ncbi:hypothetical protein TNIN_110451 [Trichonephila inaurata madagascariensis]|uniref:Uncharacterized protein n=1 Tax=Trichonephila inaurata madagascariensis TaxID=2747483 RepID=A0A8X6WP37_9ARAC|nr:hypothetical protein TNIN_110451 [Trichonephila inaurata madagascariensis]
MGDSDHRMEETTTKEEDDRIACCNSRHLDKILDVAVAHVKQLADCHLTESSKSQFVSRFTEVFKNTIQQNVTVNAHKRKHIPKQCSRMYSMQLKHERQNLKKANIEHSISLSAASFPNSPYSDRTEELTTILENMMSTKKVVALYNIF